MKNFTEREGISLQKIRGVFLSILLLTFSLRVYFYLSHLPLFMKGIVFPFKGISQERHTLKLQMEE